MGEATPPRAAAEPAQAMRVLYVDDDPALGRLVTRTLRRHGMTAEFAEGGEAGLARLAGGGFDAVALDHEMPGRDGLAVLRAIRAMPGAPPVVYVTGSQDLRIAVAALKGGAADFVLKDVQGEFMTRLREALMRAAEAAALRREVDRAQEMVRELNRSLERRVEERTQALEQAYGRLREEAAERERIEARLTQTQRLEALGQLAGGIAHDFNNVLQAVLGGAKLAGRRAEDPDFVRRITAVIVEAAERGASVTRRLLAFARRGELRAEAVEPQALLDGLAEMLRHTLGAEIALRVEAEPGLPTLHADRGQLETVLVNLATNARDAMMPGGGVLTLRAGLHPAPAADGHAAGPAAARHVRLQVADTGSGMDAATLERAVEPFFTTKPQGKGTGLGLAMAKGFAEQSNGALAIASRPGDGTTVTLWLPASEAAATQPAAPLLGEGAMAETVTALSPRLLLVEDEALVRAVLSASLASAGFQVVEASDAEGALALLRAGERPHALVTDFSMPGRDGLSLILEARSCIAGLPAVLLTGNAGGSGARPLHVPAEVPAGGPFEILRKPVAPEQLAGRIGALLRIAAETRQPALAR